MSHADALTGQGNWSDEPRRIGQDGLRMHAGMRGMPTREYLARRDGDTCELSVTGRNGDTTCVHGTVPSEDFYEAVISYIPSVDWYEFYDGDSVDGYDWSLQVRWDNEFIIRSGGHVNGPDGYRTIIEFIEDAYCSLIGAPSRDTIRCSYSDRMLGGMFQKRRKD